MTHIEKLQGLNAELTQACKVREDLKAQIKHLKDALFDAKNEVLRVSTLIHDEMGE